MATSTLRALTTELDCAITDARKARRQLKGVQAELDAKRRQGLSAATPEQRQQRQAEKQLLVLSLNARKDAMEDASRRVRNAQEAVQQFDRDVSTAAAGS